jgi:histidine ammonia-lyase
MGNTAALKNRQVLNNVEHILAIELMAAAQGIDFRRETQGENARLGAGTAPVYKLIRTQAPFIEADTIMYTYINAIKALIVSGKVDQVVTETLG